MVSASPRLARNEKAAARLPGYTRRHETDMANEHTSPPTVKPPDEQSSAGRLIAHLRKHQTESADLVTFIPASLDDAGLTPAQFRIFCHVSRVGECWQSGPAIAETCRIHPDTVWPAVAELISRRMVSRERRPGTTSVLRVMPVSDWKPTGKEGAPEKDGHPSVSSRRHRKARGSHPLEKKGHKGYPSEGYPIKEANPLAPVQGEGAVEPVQCEMSSEAVKLLGKIQIHAGLDCPEFKAAWLAWFNHLDGVGLPKVATAKIWMNQLAGEGLQTALARLRASRSKGGRILLSRQAAMRAAG